MERQEKFIKAFTKELEIVNKKHEIIKSEVYEIDFSKVNIILGKNYRKKQLLELLGIEVLKDDYVNYKITSDIFEIITRVILNVDVKPSNYGTWYKVNSYNLDLKESVFIGVIAYQKPHVLYPSIECDLVILNKTIGEYYDTINE